MTSNGDANTAIDQLYNPSSAERLQNDTRHQLRFVVDDAAAMAARARRFSATVESAAPLDDQLACAIIRAPDGNAWEFVSMHA